MSRLPRETEHLKTGFTAEAVSAARFRAYAARAEKDGLPNLAKRWLGLAGEKDTLAVAQLEAAGQVRGAALDIGAALAEESYENDVLYPKMQAQVGAETAAVLARVIGTQKDHQLEISRLREAYNASQGDIPA